MPTLFDHSVAPAGAQFLDGSPGIKVCTTFTFESSPGVGVAGQVTEIWFYVGPNVGGTWTAVGWEVTNNDVGNGGTGTMVANQALAGSPTANAWNKVTLTTPVDIPANADKRWRFGVHNGQYYWANNTFFDNHDEVNFPIVAYRNNEAEGSLGIIWQGTFAVDSNVTRYPNNTGNKANYGIDVTFVPSSGGSPSFFVYNGTTEVPAAVSVWNGTSEVPMSSFSIAP